jgi:hypothetical protein
VPMPLDRSHFVETRQDVGRCDLHASKCPPDKLPRLSRLPSGYDMRRLATIDIMSARARTRRLAKQRGFRTGTT